MPKARRAPIWVVWSRRIGCCRMACDNLWCRMNAERRSPVRRPARRPPLVIRAKIGSLAKWPDQRTKYGKRASERASKRPSFLSSPLSCSDETTFPLSLSLSSAAEREAILFPRDSWRIRGRPNHETSLDSRTTYRHPGDLLSLRCLVRMRQARSFKSSKFPKEAGHCLFEVSFSRTEMGLSIATRFCDCYRPVEEDVISNIRN